LLLLIFVFLSISPEVFPAKGKAQAKGKGPKPILQVGVDPRVELMCVLFRLAGNPEYNHGRVESYAADVDRYFAPYKNHPAVKRVIQLRNSRHVGYDAPMILAVQLDDIDTLRPRLPMIPPPPGWDLRWSPRDTEEFLELARDFVRKTRFQRFMRQHKDLYDRTEDELRDVIKRNVRLDWFGRFFGPASTPRFKAVPGLLTGPLNIGPRFISGSGRDEFYCILGVPDFREQGVARFADKIPILVHEFCHSYANPVVERHMNELKEIGPLMFEQVKDRLERQGYGRWQSMMYETIVRTCVVRYLRDCETPGQVRQEIDRQRNFGFLWVESLADVLDQYEAQRNRYIDFESFFPRIVDYLNKTALKTGNTKKAMMENSNE